MAKDRLEELLRETAHANPKYKMKATRRKASPDETVSLSPNFKIPSIMKSSKKEQDSLDGIFKQVAMINSWIESIKSDTTSLKQCHMLVQQSTRPEATTKDKIQDLMGNIRSLSSRAKGSLEDFRSRKEKSDSGARRVMETQYLIITKNFSDAMEEYRTTLDLYKKRNEDILKKQLMITDKEVTNEELSNMLDSDETAIFADDYLKDTAHARQQLLEARTRHAEIIKIEKEIIEIRDLFFELAMHVNIQGEMIDSIEYHVMKGVNRTQCGTEKLVKANEKRSKYRKRKVFLIICILLVIIILILILLL